MPKILEQLMTKTLQITTLTWTFLHDRTIITRITKHHA